MRIYRKNNFFDDKNGFLIKKYNAQVCTFLHSHDFIEIIFVIKGKGIHTIDNVEYIISDGSIFCVQIGQKHSLVFSDKAEYYNIFCTNRYAKKIKLLSDNQAQQSFGDIVSADPQRFNPIYISAKSLNEMIILFETIFNEWNSKHAYYKEIINSQMKTMLLLCLRIASEGNRSDENGHSSNVLPRIIDYINLHYNEKLSLQEIAQLYHYNPAYLGRLFKKIYGITVNEFCFTKRLEKAKELLASTEYNIYDISLSVGFSNTTLFYNQFRKHFGCSPKEFRKKADNS